MLCLNTATNPVSETAFFLEQHSEQFSSVLNRNNTRIKNKNNFIYIMQQTKRKLDDVAKRLESLYDLLRDNRVSGPNLIC